MLKSLSKNLKMRFKKKEFYIDFAIGYTWILSLLIQTLSGLFYNSSFGTLITISLYGIAFVLILKNKFYLRIIDIFTFLFFGFLIIQVLWTALIYPENTKMISSAIAVWVFIPLYWCSGILTKECLNPLKVICEVSRLGVLLGWFSFLTSLEQTSKDMSFAYLVLIQVIAVIEGAFSEKKISYILCSIIGFGLLFLLGTRGPVLYSLLYVAFRIICSAKDLKSKIMIISFIGILVYFIMSSNYYIALKYLNDYLLKCGIDSYILKHFLMKNTASMDGRRNITGILLNMIWRKPFTGYGIWGEYQFTNIYAHNILIELLIDYGIIVGGIFFTVLVFRIIIVAKKTSLSNKRLVYVLVFGFLLKLFMSGSYISDLGFFYTMGIITGINLKKRKNFI